MKPARRPTPTAVSMRRWLCAWLALLVALQLAASVLSGLHGSLHRHRPGLLTAVASASTLALRWDHARRDALAAHHALHERGEWHAHDLHDTSVVSVGADLAGDALAHLAGVFAPAQRHGAPVRLHAAARHALPHAPAWSATSRTIAPLLKPPRG